MIVYIELQISLALSCMLLTMNHETDEENEYLVPYWERSQSAVRFRRGRGPEYDSDYKKYK